MVFIALEGIDACGKHTQSEKLKDYFLSKNLHVNKFDLPEYKSKTGEIIGGYLSGHINIGLTPEAGIALFDRAQLYHSAPDSYIFQCIHLANKVECIPDELWERDSNKVYISDRYNASSYAYGDASNLNLDWIISMHRNLPQPDFNILLDISVEESFLRRPLRRDKYEENKGFLQNVRKSYLKVFNTLGSNYYVVDAQKDEESVFNEIIRLVERK